MKTAIKKGNRRPVTKKYFFRCILYQIGEFVNRNERDLIGAVAIMIIWLSGFVGGILYTMTRFSLW